DFRRHHCAQIDPEGGHLHVAVSDLLASRMAQERIAPAPSRRAGRTAARVRAPAARTARGQAMNKMEIREILDYLPHRFPFLLIDRVLELEEGKRIVAVKNVAINEPFFQGHFPGNPVMPGVMILEALAQAAAILSFRNLHRE